MAKEEKLGCARPTGGPVGEKPPKEARGEEHAAPRENGMIKVGRKAPDFTAPAYHKGKFTREKLSDHLGRWTLLCFYPGDFTFV